VICFRDREFCGQPTHSPDCPRPWTPELQAEAERWWQGFGGDSTKGPPVAFGKYCEGSDDAAGA
jgi:hypothetical protein